MSYTPTFPPATPTVESLTDYTYQELAEVSNALHEVNLIILDELHVAPDRPRNGQVVYADGTKWNPGSGRGIYFYDDSVPGWIKL